MERKRLILVLSVAALVALLLCAGLITSAVKFVRGRLPTPTSVPAAITRCDQDASGLCLVSFGTNINNELVINLELADEDFPPFYARVTNRGTAREFRCEIIKEAPSSAYCLGPRTPLGEPLELSLYASADDRLLAVGTFLLQAVALPTFSDATATLLTEEGTSFPEETPGTPTPGQVGTPGSRTPTRIPTRTPTPPIGYPP